MVQLTGLQAMKIMLSFIPLMILAGCSDAHDAVELNGMSFCVPENHLIPDVALVRPDGRSVRDSGGIAINNCLTDSVRHANDEQRHCLFSGEIDSVALYKDDGFRNVIWAPGFKDSTAGRVAMSSDTKHTLSDDRKLLLMENQSIWRSWYVWHRIEGEFDSSHVVLTSGDTLLASCTKATSASSIEQNGAAFACRRRFVANSVAVSYSFGSQSRMPSTTSIFRLDENILATLKNFRCH